MTNKLSDIVRRMRHRKGFGVHSPLAFSMTERVIRRNRRYAFYAYHFLDSPDEKRILRLINFLHPARIDINPADKNAQNAVAHSGNLKKDAGDRLLIDTLSDSSFQKLISSLRSGIYTAIYCRPFSTAESEQLKHQLSTGLVFTAKSYSIIIIRAKTPLQVYEV